MAEPVYEGPEDPVPAEEAEVLDPSTSFIDKTAAGPQIAAPGQPELADAEETLAGAPNAAAPALGSVQSGLRSNTQIQGNFPGLLEPGNIDLTNRPQVKNPDGSVSTVRSASFNIDGKEVLLPTVSPDGRNLTDDQAVELYKRTGQHLGKFKNPDSADAYAQSLHEQQASAYGLNGTKAPATPQEAGAGAFAATQEGIDALKAKAAAGQELDDNERDRLAAAAQDERDIQVQRELEAQAQKDARDEFMAKKNAADEKVRDYKFHDYFDDPAHGSKALARFAVFLGGLGNLGGQAPGAPNRALDSLETNIRADHDQQLAYLNSAKYFADKQAEGVTDLLKQQQSDRQQAELEYANKKLATADKFAELAQTARGKINQAAADVEIAKLRKSGYDDQGKVQAEIAKQHLEDLQGQAALARAQRYAHKGGGGGGGNADNFAAFEAAAQAIPPGAPVPKEVYALAFKAGFKTKDVQAEVDKARESGKKSLPPGAPGKAGSGAPDPKASVFGLNHKFLGYAATPRGVDKLNLRAQAFEQAEDFLQKLIDSGRHIPKGPELANAALAIVGTTTAPPNEMTQKHEEDTLKDAFGFVSPKAVKYRLEEIKHRHQELLDSLLQPSDFAKPGEVTPAGTQLHAKLESLGAKRLD